MARASRLRSPSRRGALRIQAAFTMRQMGGDDQHRRRMRKVAPGWSTAGAGGPDARGGESRNDLIEKKWLQIQDLEQFLFVRIASI